MKISTYRHGRHLREEWLIEGQRRILIATIWCVEDDLAAQVWQAAQRLRSRLAERRAARLLVGAGKEWA